MPTLADATIEALDAFWSSQTSCVPGDFDSDDISIVESPAKDGSDFALVFRRKRRLQITCSSSLLDLLRDATRDQPHDVVVDSDFLRRALAGRVDRIIGPAFLGYLDTLPMGPYDSDVRILATGDAAALDDLRREVSPQDWEHCGLAPGQPMAGCFVSSGLVSAAGYEVWGERIAHIGVVTRPEARSTGYGRRCVQAITNHALAHGLIAQYRTLFSNAGAMAIARHLGFSEYAATIYVVPTAT